MQVRPLILYSVVLYLFLLAVGALYLYYTSGQSFRYANASGASGSEQKTARFFDSIRNQPGKLQAFLRQMPKGGDLHSHLSGAIYAETFIDLAARSNLCLDTQTLKLSSACKVLDTQKSPLVCQPVPTPTPPPSAQATPAPVNCAPPAVRPVSDIAKENMDSRDIPLYRAMVDAWSMRNWQMSGQNGHDKFFDTFDKFGAATEKTGEMLAEVMARAAGEQVSYLELMLGTDNRVAKGFGEKQTWNNGLGVMRDELLSKGLREEAVKASRKTLDDAETMARDILRCGTSEAQPGCNVTVRYLYQVGRGSAKEQVFAQLVAGFEIARDDRRVVGLNLVQPEDYLVPRRDFRLHMSMLDFLHNIYPEVHISLHAGELAAALVPPADLRFHIRESVEKGHAERIGHGVDIMYEEAPFELLRELAQRGVMVEICLTSNETILGVRGAEHPLAIYIENGVPVALATDDEGVSRSNMTDEYLKAIKNQNLDYLQLKKMARTSLEHAFIAGLSLWKDAKTGFALAAQPCANDSLDKSLSTTCQQFLESNERARLQWELEKAFYRFESQYQ